MAENWVHEIVSVKTPPIPSVWAQTFSRELTNYLRRLWLAWSALEGNDQADNWGGAESLQVVCRLMFPDGDLMMLNRLHELIEQRAVALGQAAADQAAADPPPDFPP